MSGIHFLELILLVGFIITIIMMLLLRHNKESFITGYITLSIIILVITFFFCISSGEEFFLFGILAIGIILIINYIIASIISAFFKLILFPNEIKRIEVNNNINVPSLKKCSHCNKEWDENYEFCPQCSKKLE